MQILKIALIFMTISSGLVPLAHGQRALPPPVHPDTLPTLTQKWKLPASLAPYITNTHTPRMTRKGMLLYVFDHHGRRLVAVKAMTGKVVWHVPVPSRSDRTFSVTPLVIKDRVYVATDGYLFSFDALTGKLKWQLGTKGVAINGLARSKHHIFLPWIAVKGRNAQDGVNLWAVDSRLGRVEWNKKFPGRMAFVTGDADGVYYTSDNGVVLGLTADRGDPKWQQRIKGKVTSSPLLHSGTLYIAASQKKAGWSGYGIHAIDVNKGKQLWQTKLPTPKVSMFLDDNKLIVVLANGKLIRFGSKGEPELELELGFGDEPTSFEGVAGESRAFIFSRHGDGNGYIRLVDLTNKRVLAVANALDMDVRSIIPAAKMLFLDGANGDIYAYRMDQSQRPLRATVSPIEFAQDMLGRAANSNAAIKGLDLRLAGLGNGALPAIDDALQSPNTKIASAAARAIGLIKSRKSVPALLAAMDRLKGAPSTEKVEPTVAIIEALGDIRDRRSIQALQQLMTDETQDHHCRRAAYVALGAIGSPVAMAPIWSFRATKEVPSTQWKPRYFTSSFDYKVESDPEVEGDSWPEAIRSATSLTNQKKEDEIVTVALSPFLGGYNDIWIGRSDLAGSMITPLFTGLTKPEMSPNRRIRFKQLEVLTASQVQLVIEMQDQKQQWIPAKPLKLSMKFLSTDSDNDKLPDVVEQRLRLGINNQDSDGDGLKDGEDVNPLASGKLRPSTEQILFREAFFTFYAFLKRRGIVVVDPGDGPSFELYGRQDPVLSLRRPTIEKFRKEVGLHAVDYISFGGPYPEGSGSGDALPNVIWNAKKTEATIGMDIFRSAENAVAYNVTLIKVGKKWVVSRFFRVWTTN